MYRFLLALLVIPLFSNFCFADSLTKNLVVNPMAIAIAEEKVQKGDITAMCILGLLYREGNHVPQNYKKAKELFQKCADKEEPFCQLFLGEMYVQGQGSAVNPQNDIKARQWFTKSAAHNIPDAQFRLGLMYERGVGGVKNVVKARQLYEKAAQKNDLNGQFFLAKAYLNGMGGVKDIVKAKVLAKQSCNNHNQQGCDLYKDLSK